MLLHLFNQKVIITLSQEKTLSNMNDGKQSSRFNPTKITSNAILWGRSRTKQKNFFFSTIHVNIFFFELFSCLVNVSIMFCPFQHPPYKHAELGLNTFCLDEYLLVYYMVTIWIRTDSYRLVNKLSGTVLFRSQLVFIVFLALSRLILTCR